VPDPSGPPGRKPRPIPAPFGAAGRGTPRPYNESWATHASPLHGCGGLPTVARPPPTAPASTTAVRVGVTHA